MPTRCEDRDVEPEITELIQPKGHTPLGADLTPGQPTARVAEAASRELGQADLEDAPMDPARDITPDQIERRGAVEESTDEETARPLAPRPSAAEEP